MGPMMDGGGWVPSVGHGGCVHDACVRSCVHHHHHRSSLRVHHHPSKQADFHHHHQSVVDTLKNLCTHCIMLYVLGALLVVVSVGGCRAVCGLTGSMSIHAL